METDRHRHGLRLACDRRNSLIDPCHSVHNFNAISSRVMNYSRSSNSIGGSGLGAWRVLWHCDRSWHSPFMQTNNVFRRRRMFSTHMSRLRSRIDSISASRRSFSASNVVSNDQPIYPKAPRGNAGSPEFPAQLSGSPVHRPCQVVGPRRCGRLRQSPHGECG